MAKEEIVYSVSVEGNAGKSLSDLKKEFKDSQKELSKLTQGTKEYYDQLKKVAAVKDEMGDLRDTIESFKPDQKLRALGNVVTVVASGFTAAQGAMALFGADSKDLEKTLVKVQAAMAFSQGLQGLQGLGDAFNLLKANLMQFTIFQKIATAAQWLWNAAMNANPVLLIVTGVTALVGAIGLLVSAQNDEAESLERVNELRKQGLATREKDIDLIKQKQKALESTSTFELELAKAQGKSSDELYKIEHDNIQKRIDDLELLKWYRADGKLTAQEIAEQNNLRKQLALLEIKQLTDAHNDFVKKSDERKKKNKEDAEKVRQDNLDAYNKRADDLNSFIDKEEEAKRKAREKENEAKRKEEETDKQRAFELGEWKIQYEKDRLAREKADAEAEQLARVELAKATNQSLINLSDIYFSVKNANLKKGSAEELKSAKQQFKINKALAMSGAIITGVQSVMAAYKSGVETPIIGPATGAAYAAIAGLTSAANIAKIASQQFSESGSGAGVSGGVSSPEAPQISAPRNDSTLLNANGTIVNKPQKETPTIKAYVVESEITSTQRKVNSIEQNAKI